MIKDIPEEDNDSIDKVIDDWTLLSDNNQNATKLKSVILPGLVPYPQLVVTRQLGAGPLYR